MIRTRFSILLIMLFLFNCRPLAFQLNTNPINFSDSDVIYKVNDYVQVYETPDTISSQEAWSRIVKGEMDRVPYKGNPGMTNSDVAYWLVFSITNQLEENNELRLELSYPQLDLAQLAEVKGDSARTLYITGDSFNFNKRPVRNHNFVFPLSMAFGEQKTYLLNADKRKSAVRFPLRLYSLDHFESKTNKEQTYLTIYYVFLTILILISLIIGLGLKRMVFVWYGLSVLAYAIWLFTWQGFTYKYITFNNPVLNRHFLAFCSQMAVVALLVFVQSYFETKKLLPKFNKVMNGVLIIFGIGTVVWVIIPNTFIAFAPKLFAVRYFLVGLIVVFSIVASIKYHKKRLHRSVIFAISYSLFFVALVAKILDEYGVISEYNFLVDPVLIGNLVQVLGLSIAMTITLINIVKERETLKETNAKLQESINNNEKVSTPEKAEYFTLKSKAVIQLGELIYISSDGGYCEFYLNNKDHPEIDRRSLTSLEEELPDNFVRIHRSTIVNMKYAKQVKASSIILNSGQQLVISRTYKNSVQEALGTKKG